MNVRRWLAATCCVPLLALAACSEDEPNAEPDDPASTSSPSPSPSETGQTIPPAAQGTDEASAKAFVRYFFSTMTEAMNSGDTASFVALSASGCASCSAIRASISKTFADGGYAKTEGWRPRTFAPFESASGAAFDMKVRMGEERFFNADGKVTHHFTGDMDRRMVIYLRPRETSWEVTKLDIER